MIQRCKNCESNRNHHEFQDERYAKAIIPNGPFNRVFTECPRGAKDMGYTGRCTICGEKQTFSSQGG
jgi:hypothetical protein